MNVIHSFWSKAYFHGRWGQESKIHMDLYSFALSFHYAKKLYKRVSLVTDYQGLSLFSCIPYDDITLGLTQIEHVNPGFWTAGKVQALKLQTKPTLHIDGDVFLMDNRVKHKMSGEWDVCVQMREVGDHYNSTYPPIFRNLEQIYPWIKDLSIFNFAYNTGIFGFQNQELKMDYCLEYFNLLEMLSISGVQFPPKQDPNIVVEQSLLTRMASYRNAHVKELITLDEMEREGLFEHAARIGFVHLWGNSKYQDYWHQKVKAKLKEENPKLFQSVQDMINDL